MIHHRYLKVFDNWNIYIWVHHGLGPHGEQQSQFVNHLVCFLQGNKDGKITSKNGIDIYSIIYSYT